MPTGVSSKSRGDVLPLFIYEGEAFLNDLSIFVDESGDQGGHSKYYVLTLVFHNQNNDINPELKKYRQGLDARQLENLPFHAESSAGNRLEDGGAIAATGDDGARCAQPEMAGCNVNHPSCFRSAENRIRP